MSKRRRKKKYKYKRPVSLQEIEERMVSKETLWGIRQFRNTRYWVDTRGIVYYRKGGKKFKPIPIYEYRNYYACDLYIERRGKTVKKRYDVHRLVGECFYTQNTLLPFKELTVHHLHSRYSNTVNDLYVCNRAYHDLCEYEERPVQSNLDYSWAMEEDL